MIINTITKASVKTFTKKLPKIVAVATGTTIATKVVSTGVKNVAHVKKDSPADAVIDFVADVVVTASTMFV